MLWVFGCWDLLVGCYLNNMQYIQVYIALRTHTEETIGFRVLKIPSVDYNGSVVSKDFLQMLISLSNLSGKSLLFDAFVALYLRTTLGAHENYANNCVVVNLF